MRPVVLLAVAPHSDLHLLLLVPAVAHGHLFSTPSIHGLRTWSCQTEKDRQKTEYQQHVTVRSHPSSCTCKHLRGLWWVGLPHPDADSRLSLLRSSQPVLLSIGFPQADVPLSTVTDGAPTGSPHDEDSFCWEYGSPHPGREQKQVIIKFLTITVRSFTPL